MQWGSLMTRGMNATPADYPHIYLVQEDQIHPTVADCLLETRYALYYVNQTRSTKAKAEDEDDDEEDGDEDEEDEAEADEGDEGEESGEEPPPTVRRAKPVQQAKAQAPSSKAPRQQSKAPSSKSGGRKKPKTDDSIPPGQQNIGQYLHPGEQIVLPVRIPLCISTISRLSPRSAAHREPEHGVGTAAGTRHRGESHGRGGAPGE
jgi:hypothetical protein